MLLNKNSYSFFFFIAKNYNQLMRIILVILFIAYLSFAPAKAEWVNIQDIKQPIRLLDTNSIKNLNYKDNKGTIFALRYMDKNGKENVATFFADFKNKKAGVISIKPYSNNMQYDFTIPNDFEMKNISDFKTNFSEIEKYVNGKMIKNSANSSPNTVQKSTLTDTYLKEENVLEKMDKEENKAGASSPKLRPNPVNWNPYMIELEKRIKKNWHPPKVEVSNKIVILFKISKEGNLINYKIQQSSNNKLADESVIRAIKLTMPYEPFPKEATAQSIDIEFTFDYNVLKYDNYSPKVSPNNTWRGKFLKGTPI